MFFAVSLPQYMTKFQWDLAKYPIKQSLKNISDIISKVNLVCVTIFSVIMFDYMLFFDCCELKQFIGNLLTLVFRQSIWSVINSAITVSQLFFKDFLEPSVT